MGDSNTPLTGPALESGIPLTDLSEGKLLLGHCKGEQVLLSKSGEEIFAVSAFCTHYHGPLAEGVHDKETVRCPWHHACFSLRSGAVMHGPALNALDCWRVEKKDGKAFVVDKIAAPAKIVIVGAGAAGTAASEMLRKEGYAGEITMVDAENALPSDRPNLSKDYLAGNAPEEWIFLRSQEFFKEQKIQLRLGTKVLKIDPRGKTVALSSGDSLAYDRLILAMGGTPSRLPIPGADLPHVHVLRSVADSRAIIERTKKAKRAVVIGASFIALEVAASLRARKLEVDIVAPDKVPLERVLGPELGAFIKGIHEQNGVKFHLGEKPASVDAQSVTLASGAKLPADLVVLGVGVKPEVRLAEEAGLKVDNGVVVDSYLETSVPGIFAVGDIARYPNPSSPTESWRIEHWVVAQNQGRTAAKNALGRHEAYKAVPFFWSAHFDVTLGYVGHALAWDKIEIHGKLEARDCTVVYRNKGRIEALATIGRDQVSLNAEVAFEKSDRAALERIVRG